MVVFKLDSTPAQAFMHGFAKGFAAPLMLYGRFEDPVKIPEVRLVEVAPRPDSVWVTVGGDIQNAIKSYEIQSSHRQP